MNIIADVIKKCAEEGVTDFKVIGTRLFDKAKELEGKIQILTTDLVQCKGLLSEIKKFLSENPVFNIAQFSQKKSVSAVIDSDLSIFETDKIVQNIANNICALISQDNLLPREILDNIKSKLDPEILLKEDVDTMIFATIKFLCDKEILARNEKLVVKGSKWNERHENESY